jgi:SAM-dependent methyltransferase
MNADDVHVAATPPAGTRTLPSTTSVAGPDRFEFGANWTSFVERALDDRRVASAVADTRRLLGDSLEGLTLIDIGCGSGLFSLAAHLLGARRVVAFDYDPRSVGASETLRERFRVPPDRWSIAQGSILDAGFLSGLEPADVVYSWGVLHHTGDMWRAIENAGGLTRPGGRFAIAIYNRVARFPDRSDMWWKVKRFYVRSPRAVRRMMEAGYALNHMATRLITLRNPLRPLLEQTGQGRRGMEFWHDVRDWLGGFPYEYATAGEVFAFVHRRLGMELVSLDTVEGNACNEFVFRRPG